MNDVLLLAAAHGPHPLATLNAALNGLATLLLIVGFLLIKRGRIDGHRRVMLSAFGVSALFLVSYLTYHTLEDSRPFAGVGPIRTVYFTILISHVILAAFVPILAIYVIRLGLQDKIGQHRFWAKITFPIWLYVSITGVVIYVMLYLLYPGENAVSIMN